MARIAGVDLPKDKRIEVALTYIFGIGLTSSKKILNKGDVDPNIRVKDMKETDVASIRKIIENDYRVEGELRSEVGINIKRLMDIGSYRGIRHRRGLPVRGQRTKTNSRTRKGHKRTVPRKKK